MEAPQHNAALQVSGLGKRFHHRSTGAAPTFRAWVQSGFRRTRGSAFWALQGVDFTLYPGEMLGVIGRNGSGKSTLLRLLGGVMRPDAGRVRASGPVSGLLELNTGMHPDLTGRENIRISAVLGGLLLSEVEARMEAIIAFAELEAHIDDPVRTYSSGMRLRLGFAVAVHVDPGILLIDEVLAVGDLGFQQKCLARIAAFKQAGVAIVLISHDLAQVQAMCDRVMWLDRGVMRGQGAPDQMVALYEQTMAAERLARSQADAAAAPDATVAEAGLADSAVGTGDLCLSGFGFLDAAGAEVTQVAPGAAVTFALSLTAAQPVADWQVSLTFWDGQGRNALDFNSDVDQVALPSLGPGPASLAIDFGRLDLAPGGYTISLGLWSGDWDRAFDYRQEAMILEVVGGAPLKGVLDPPRSWRMGSMPG